jgi:hypothetical protein
MINARSLSELAPAGAPPVPHPQGPSSHQMDMSASDVNRRYNLTVGGSSTGQKRVLAPESSSPEQGNGGFVGSGDANRRVYYNPPPRPVVAGGSTGLGIDGGIDRRYVFGHSETGDDSEQPSSRDGSAPPPRKRLLRESDLLHSMESSAAVSPAATPVTPSGFSTPSPVATPHRLHAASAPPVTSFQQTPKQMPANPLALNIAQPPHANAYPPTTVAPTSAPDSSPPITRPPLSRLHKGPRPAVQDDEESPPRPPAPVAGPVPSPRRSPMPGSTNMSTSAALETIRRIHQQYFPMLDFRVVYETVVNCRGDMKAAVQLLRQRFRMPVPGQPGQPQVTARTFYQSNGATYAPATQPTYRHPGYLPGTVQPANANHIPYARASSAPQPVPRPVARPPPKPASRKRRVYDDSDTGDEYGSDASEDYVDKEDQRRKELRGLVFFNEGNVSELPDLTGKYLGHSTRVAVIDARRVQACTPKQAEVIISMRPFESVEDLRTKLRKRKGVSAGLFDSYLDIMDVSILAIHVR